MKADKQTVMRLVKTARGQLENDRYCIDISNQLLATQSILSRANREVLKAHISGCVKEAVEADDADAKIDEILTLVDKLGR